MQDKDSKKDSGLRSAVDEIGNPNNGIQDHGGYDLAEAVTGLKRSTLQSMVCRHQIPFMRLGPRLPVFSRSELIQWMAERRVVPGSGVTR